MYIKAISDERKNMYIGTEILIQIIITEDEMHVQDELIVRIKFGSQKIIISVHV